jgi:hypothetical protein
MDLGDATAYLRHHLTLAGRSDPLFADDAIVRLHRFSNGIPRALGHGLTEVHSDHSGSGSARTRHLGRFVAETAAHVDRRLALVEAQAVEQGEPPGLVSPPFERHARMAPGSATSRGSGADVVSSSRLITERESVLNWLACALGEAGREHRSRAP